MKIDFVSDVSCPWCAIGLASLEAALARLAGEVAVALHFQPFELNPQMPPGGDDVVEHLGRKYGMAAAQVQQSGEAIRARGEALGFTFRMDLRRRIYNTFDAHRLLHWAGLEDAASDPAGSAQHALKKRLLAAYFGQGLDPGDPAVLTQAAEAAGLPGARAAQILAGDEFAAAVRDRERFYLDQGIHAVPAVIIDDRHLIEGGQPPEVFERALRQIAAQAGR